MAKATEGLDFIPPSCSGVGRYTVGGAMVDEDNFRRPGPDQWWRVMDPPNVPRQDPTNVPGGTPRKLGNSAAVATVYSYHVPTHERSYTEPLTIRGPWFSDFPDVPPRWVILEVRPWDFDLARWETMERKKHA